MDSFNHFVIGLPSILCSNSDELTMYCDQLRLPEINNSPIDLAPKLVFDSPFVQSKWNSGVVTITYGQDKKVLNFNN
jgi:hypothetical protein